MVTIFILVSNPIMIAVVALAVLVACTSQVEYLALKLVPARELKLGLIGLVVLIVASDLLLYLSGRDLVTPFQLQSYTSAGAEGWLWPMLAGAILVAPAGEEVMFRGFLFRGWARSERTVWPAIIVISLLWATLHVQYDWTGIVQIFVIGLFLGWIRRRSGSTLLTFLLHALFNLEGTMETVLQIRFFQ
jgi:membrane protease YdiL (CAAX protease family)